MTLSPELWDFVGRLLDVVDERYKGDRLLRVRIAADLCRCLNLTEEESDQVAVAERFWFHGQQERQFKKIQAGLQQRSLYFLFNGLSYSNQDYRNMLLHFCFASGGMEDENGDYIITSASACGISDDVIKSVVRRYIAELR